MSAQVTIYALLDPDGTPRYVGRTAGLLEQRLAQHMRESHYRWRRRFPRSVWIAGLVAAGQAPLIEAIAVAPAAEADVREREHIACYLARGYNLVNGTHTPQHRLKAVALRRAYWARRQAPCDQDQTGTIGVSLRLPRELHGRIQEMARGDERSLHAQIVWCLRQCEQRARRTRKNVNGLVDGAGELEALAARAATVPPAPAPEQEAPS